MALYASFALPAPRTGRKDCRTRAPALVHLPHDQCMSTPIGIARLGQAGASEHSVLGHSVWP
eukprot:7971305-Prorocentrum_lima.AAC.1